MAVDILASIIFVSIFLVIILLIFLILKAIIKPSKKTILEEKGVKHKPVKEIKEKPKGTLYAWLVIIFFILLTIILLNTIKVPYSAITTEAVKEPFPITKTEYIKEPKMEEECHNKIALYSIEYISSSPTCLQQECSSHYQVCIDKNWLGNCLEYAERCQSYKCVKYRRNCGIKLINKEREKLYFDIKLFRTDYDNDENKVIINEKVWVSALDERDLYWIFTYSPTESIGCTYGMDKLPQIEVCEKGIVWKEVKKEVEDTEWKDVEKTKIITKYETIWDAITGAHSYEKA